MSRTENHIIWDCIVSIFKNDPTIATRQVVDFVIDYYRNDGEEINNNFSHDNWTAVLCWYHKFLPKRKTDFPLFGDHSKHPMRFIRYSWMKYPILFPLRLISLLEMFIQYGIIRRKTNSGNYHTSELLLDFYIHNSYNNKIEMFVLTKLMKTMFNSWAEVFRAYHGNPDHDNYRVYTAFIEEQNETYI